MKENRIVIFTRYFLNFMFYSGIVVVLLLPLLVRLALKYYTEKYSVYYLPMLVILGISGICGLTIVFQLRKMIKTVLEKNCFVEHNIRSLKIMGKVSFLITALFVVKCFFLLTPATLVIILTFFISGIFSFVLSLVFMEAVRFKEENDLTI